MHSNTAVRWEQEGELISFNLVSNGMTGEEWIAHFAGRRIPVSENAKAMLRALQPTPAGTVHRIRILMGRIFATAQQRTTASVRNVARAIHYKTPHPELAPLMRDAFTDEEIKKMGASTETGEKGLEEIVTFHEPVNGRFLDIDTETGELESAPADDGDTWHEGHGFAFEE